MPRKVAAPIQSLVGREDPPLRLLVGPEVWQQQARDRFWELWARPEPGVRDACLRLLGQGYARSMPRDRRARALAEHLDDPYPLRRRWCLWALEQLGDDPFVDEALDRLARRQR